MRSKRVGKIHVVIPDVQSRPGVDSSHLAWVGNYIAAKRPDTIICIGDFADMVSLNSYAVGKAESEGTRYKDDIENARDSMRLLMVPIRRERNYRPALHLTLGNHEHRIDREAESNPKLLGTISTRDLGYEEFGWKVWPFLKVAKLDGIEYVHYVTTGVMGRPASSAAAMLKQRHCSVVQGHVQKVDIAFHPATRQTAIMTGTCYTHDEKYLGFQGNVCFRGIWCLHEVRDGIFDPMMVSLEFLRNNYK